MNFNQTKNHRVPWLRFFFVTSLQLVLSFAVFAYAFPHRFEEETRSVWPVALLTLVFGVPLSLFEYLYHRYLLHAAVLPFLSSMFRAHTKHHSLTDVRAPVKSTDPSLLVPVVNEYSIEKPEQEESMMFPAYSVSVFYAIFLVLLGLPAYLLFPSWPVFVSVLAAVTIYYCAYELWHAVLHLPFERFWQPLFDGRRTRKTARTVYSFHLMHHWRPTCNLAVVGFWGIAVWDHVFRTHKRPGRLPLVGAEVAYEDGRLGRPLWPISAIDRCKGQLYNRSRRFERFLARLFLRKTFEN